MDGMVEYTVITKRTSEGYSAWVPGLPGCWSEGLSQAEALENIQDAIGDYLAVAQELAKRQSGATPHKVRIDVA
jgi:predicted RNase H-like HicB family nuclease